VSCAVSRGSPDCPSITKDALIDNRFILFLNTDIHPVAALTSAREPKRQPACAPIPHPYREQFIPGHMVEYKHLPKRIAAHGFYTLPFPVRILVVVARIPRMILSLQEGLKEAL
jgi:hypothetical protein